MSVATASSSITVDGAARSGSGHFRPTIPFEEVVQLCTRRLLRDPLHSASLLQRARAYMHLGNYTAAHKDLSELLASGRLSGEREADALFYRGYCSEQDGDDAAAVADYSRALEVHPSHDRAAYSRAACRNRQGDYAGAIEDYERALAAAKRDADLRRRRDGGGCPASATAFLGQRAARSHFGQARQRGDPPSAYASDVERRRQQLLHLHLQQQQQQQCRARGDGASSEVSATTHADSNGDGRAVDPSHSVANASLDETHPYHRRRNNTHGQEDMAPTEWVEGGLTGMGAMDPASLASLGSSFYSISDWSGDDMDDTDDLAPEHSAGYYVQRGLYYRKRGDLQRAVEMYTKALDIDPDHFKALFNRAFCYDKQGHLRLAIDDYSRAAAVDPSNPYTFYNLGITCDRVADLARAVEAFTEAIAKDHGRNPDFYHNRGFSLRKLGDFAAAISDYTAAIAIQPMHFKARFNRGFCYDRLGQCERAVEDYTTALTVDPKSVNALHNRGVALEKLGRLPEALGDFNSALLVDPKSAYTYNARGLVHDQMRRYEAAIADLTAAIELQPRNSVFLCNRGYAYRGMGRMALAVEDYSAAIDLNPGAVAAYNGRAFVHRKEGRYEEAVRDYTTVLERQAAKGRERRGSSASTEATHATTKALNNRAYCYARMERYADAIQDYTAVLVADPANTHALHNRAISFEKTGNYKAAVADLTNLIEQVQRQRQGEGQGAETIANAHYSRGSAWVKLGHPRRAKSDYTKALEMDLAGIQATSGAIAAEEAKQTHPAWLALQRLQAEGGR